MYVSRSHEIVTLSRTTNKQTISNVLECIEFMLTICRKLVKEWRAKPGGVINERVCNIGSSIKMQLNKKKITLKDILMSGFVSMTILFN